MTRDELQKVKEYTERDIPNLSDEEKWHFSLLLLKWMYEQGLLD